MPRRKLPPLTWDVVPDECHLSIDQLQQEIRRRLVEDGLPGRERRQLQALEGEDPLTPGDLLNALQLTSPEALARLLEETKLGPQLVRQRQWLSRRFPAHHAVRGCRLGLTQLRALTGLTDAEALAIAQKTAPDGGEMAPPSVREIRERAPRACGRCRAPLDPTTEVRVRVGKSRQQSFCGARCAAHQLIDISSKG